MPGLQGEPAKNPDRGVSGSIVRGEEVRAQTLLVGQATVRLPTMLVRDSMEAPYGQIGMDVLRGTVLVLSPNATDPLLWLVPPSFASPAQP